VQTSTPKTTTNNPYTKHPTAAHQATLFANYHSN